MAHLSNKEHKDQKMKGEILLSSPINHLILNQ